MNLVVSVEHRFDQTPDGAVWTQTQFAHASWSPYLQVFDSLRVVARVRAIDQPSDGWKRADGDGVTFASVPYFVGPWQYLLRRRQVARSVQAAVTPNDAVILRVPATLGGILASKLRHERHPFACEVVGDPYDVFAPGASRHPLAPFFRWIMPRDLRRQCRDATQSAYVTREALQRRYPCPGGEVGFSDVEITDAALVREPRSIRPEQTKFTLLFLGTMAQLYKAPDILIDAVARCRRSALDVDLVLIGDGQFRPALEEQARRLGIADHVRFRGQLPAGEAVRAELDHADLFALPSHQEGLPRAMVEAMARALPCIGSTVGGIPELLPPEDLVPPGDAAALAEKIRAVVTDPARRAKMSARNLRTAQEYHADRIAAIRRRFYEALKQRTQTWIDGRACIPREEGQSREACRA
jgi:glycosyltransferase involved in cell wall biosynthesis